MGEVVNAVAEATEGMGVTVTDVGQNQLFATRYSKYNTRRSIITSGGLFGKIDGVITRENKKGEKEVDSFIVSLKPDGTKVQISKECVFKDLNDIVQR